MTANNQFLEKEGPQKNINWTGFYIGGSGGWGWSNLTSTETPFGVSATTDILPGSVKNNLNGSLFGGQIGFNKQLKKLVIGVEGDIDGTGINGAGQTESPSLQANLSGDVTQNTSTNGLMVQNNIDWLASIRGRVGAPLKYGLLYFTAGGAWEDISSNLLSNGNINNTWSVNTPGAFSKTRAGYIVGAGFESMIATHWTIRGEYLYYNFSTTNNNQLSFSNCTTPGCGVSISATGNNINALRLGMNYKI